MHIGRLCRRMGKERNQAAAPAVWKGMNQTAASAGEGEDQTAAPAGEGDDQTPLLGGRRRGSGAKAG